MSQVSDYDIANASGAQVRADINNVLDAIKTTNSGSSDPTGAVAFMLYGDTSDNILKVRNSANSSFTEIGNINQANLGLMPIDGSTAMTGPIKLPQGSDASPSLQFASDSNTGFHNTSSDQIDFTCGGIRRMFLNNDGLSILSVNGNTKAIFFKDADGSPHASLRAASTMSTNVELKLPPSIVSGGFLKTDANGNLSFQTIAGVPAGTVFCRAASVVPDGYLECNGAAVSRSTYSGLFGIIGTQYGAGDGSSTFNLPDLRGEFIRGFDHGRGVDSNRSMASFQDHENRSHNHGYTNSGITVSGANHNHNIRKISLQPSIANVAITLGSGQSYQIGYATNDNGVTGDAVKFSGNQTMTGNVGITISNAGSEARPRNIAMMYIIKT